MRANKARAACDADDDRAVHCWDAKLLVSEETMVAGWDGAGCEDGDKYRTIGWLVSEDGGLTVESSCLIVRR